MMKTVVLESVCHAYLWQSTINFYFSPFTFKKTSQINWISLGGIQLYLLFVADKQKKEKEKKKKMGVA